MTAALEGGEWSAARPAALYPRERPGTHFTTSCKYAPKIRGKQIVSVSHIVERHISKIHIYIFLKTVANLKPRDKFVSLSADISWPVAVAFILCSSFSVMKR